MQRVFYIIVLLGYLLFSFLQAQEISVRIEINKDKYLVGELIWLDVWVTNVSDEPQNFNSGDIDITNNLHIIDSGGKRYKSHINSERYPMGWAPKFPPGSQYHISRYLPGEFGISDWKGGIFYFPPGEYTLYLPVKVPGGTNRAGVVHPELELQSNTITFSVVSPQGTDQEAFQLIERARSIFHKQPFQPDRDYSEVEEIYQSVIANYPQSPYYELVWQYYTLMYMHHPDPAKRQRSLETHLEFIRRHPDSRLVEVVIRETEHFAYPSIDFELYKNRMIQIMQEVPGTRAASYARERLDLAEKTKIIKALQSPDWKERNRILTMLDSAAIVDPEISEALINLLEEETNYYGIGLGSGLKDSDGFVSDGSVEAWGEYYWYLIRIVGKTGNENAIPYLVNSIYAAGGLDACEALVNFGEKGVLAVLDALDRPGDMEREVVRETITLMHVMKLIEATSKPLSPETNERIKHKMIPLTTDYSLVPAVRKDAVRILGHIDDPEVISHLETLAQSDPYFLPYTIRGIKSEHGGYIIREEAKKALDKLQKSKEGG